jgi:Ca2+-transporting ATPase
MFLLSGNIAELMIIFAIMIMNLAMFSNTLPLPLIAIQILWINLVMDGLPALAIAADPIEKDVMERTPRPRNQTLFHDSQRFLVYFPIIMTILVLMLFFWSFLSFGDAIKAQTMVFTAVIIFRKFTAFNCLDMNKNMIKNIFRNKFLNIVTIITLALLFAILYIPTLNSIFGTTPLNAFEWLLIIVVSAVGFVYLEAAKWFRTKKHSNKAELGNNER